MQGLKILGALVLAGTIFGSMNLPEPQTNTQTVYVSLTEKNTVETFANRWTTGEHHLVVTHAPIPGALQSIKISTNAVANLHLVEVVGADMIDQAIVRGRLGKYVVIEAQYQQVRDLHHQNPRYYIEQVMNELKTFPKTTPTVIAVPPDQTRIVSIDENYLREKLAEISGAVPVELDGEEVTISERSTVAGRRLARRWLRKEYAALGFVTSEHRYQGRRGEGFNFIADRRAEDSLGVVIVSAHLDSYSNAGADDDATGLVSSLAAAHALQDVSLRYDLRILGFDQEELGLIGSAHYAEHLNDAGTLANVAAVVNIEMTGYDGDNDGALHVIHCNENTSRTIADVVNAVIDESNTDLEVVDACTNRSDHASFWRYNRPAIVISQNFFGGDSNPCYHRSCDKVDRIDFDYMRRVTEAIASGVGRLVGR